LADTSRARAIYELGINQQLSTPEILWKSVIDFEVNEGERDRARELYEKLTTQSGHFKVWIAYALFEATAITIGGEEDDEDEEGGGAEGATVLPGDPELARQVFKRGYDDLKAKGEIEPVRHYCFFHFSLNRGWLAFSGLSCLRRGKNGRRRMDRRTT